jgi:hypothetical protein
VLFLIDLARRRAEITGITTAPNASFMAQVARNLTDCGDGFLLTRGEAIVRILEHLGLEGHAPAPAPARAPPQLGLGWEGA